MRRFSPIVLFAAGLIVSAGGASATIFGTVRGTVRDEAQRPLLGARVALHAETSGWEKSVMSDAHGAYSFALVPLGRYRLSADAAGMAPARRDVAVESGSVLSIDIALHPPRISEQIEVTAAAPAIDPRSSTTQTTIARLDIAQTPGADETNSLRVITDYVPGSYVVHDQLHVRGGHQVDWLIDGVPVPNTNIASNVGPQFDPKDIDYLEVQRGGYSSEYGDRTYAIFNVVPRSGFERNDDGQANLSFGTRRSAEGFLNLGSHTQRLAYYLSANGNHSDAGLETPIPRVIHDKESGGGLFGSLVFLPDDAHQLRLVASGRTDLYQIPNDEDLEGQHVRDREHERDAFVNLSWIDTISSSTLLTIAPFFHYNRADLDGGTDDPLQTIDKRSSRYSGAQATLGSNAHGHDARFGVFGFHQSDSQQFALIAHDGSGLQLVQRLSPSGNLGALFAQDSFDVAPWLTLRGGLRWTHFSGTVHESATSPRVGAAARLPWFGAALRVSYGHYYQAPPLATVSGPLQEVAVRQGFGFLPLRGERDRQYEIGLAVPIAGFTTNVAAFRTEAQNFFDHDALGESNIFLPLMIDRAHIRGLEATISSPPGRAARLHVAYSHQTVEGEGGVVGGLTDFSPPEQERFFLDHDQRDTLSAGATLRLPYAGWAGANVNYGSGFLNSDGPDHLPSHTTIDVAFGATRAKWSAKLSATNVTNRRYLLDLSNTFGGTHYVEPRKVMAQIGWKFRY
jgi:hypothetical protein